MATLLAHTEKIWIFLKVADCGSFLKASQALKLTQPTVSYAVKELETQLQVSLFDRTSRGVTLTAVGRMLAEDARRMKSHLLRTEDLLLNPLRTQVPRKLLIGTYESIAVYLWPRLTRRLEEQYPSTELSLITLRSAEIVERIGGGTIDVGLVVGPVNHRSVQAKLLYRDQYSFYASPGLSREQQRELPVITVPDALDVEGKTLRQWIARSRYAQNPLLSLSSFEVCAEFACEELGIAVLPNRVHLHRQSRRQALSPLARTGLPLRFGSHEFYFCFKPGVPSQDRFKEEVGREIGRLAENKTGGKFTPR